MTTIKLNDGNDIPLLGLGTYEIRGEEVNKAISYALDAGYRHIDTAKSYYNEEEIGTALKKQSIPREKIFITTKLDNDDHGYDETMKAFKKSLSKLKTDYIDLYLIHWPYNGKRIETWRAFEHLQNKGLVKSIGVSNFTAKHLQELIDNCEVVPAINQFEFNPFIYQKDIADFCKGKNIMIEAYSPIARNHRPEDKDIKNISEKYNKTPAQILLRWSLQHRAIVIPKSSNKERIIENSQIFDFEISDEDMKILNSKNENLRFSPDPNPI